MKPAFAVLVLAALPLSVAVAVPRESVTFTNVASEGPENDPANQVRTHNFTGGYQVGRVRITATLNSINVDTWPADSRIQVTPPGGTPFTVAPFADSDPFTSVTVTDGSFRTSSVVAVSAGTWSFKFFEDYVDAAAGADAQWSSIQITLDDDVSLAPGELPATANVPSGSGPLATINDVLTDAGLAQMYKIRICEPASFGASVVGGTAVDTQMFLFDVNGMGIAFDDDSQGAFQSTLTSAFTATLPVGDYFLAISEFDRDPVSSGGSIWNDEPYAAERAPDGPGAAGAVTGWEGGDFVVGGSYTITLTGACFVSTTTPCVADVDDGSMTGTSDNAVTIDDLLFYLVTFEAGTVDADVDNGTGTGTTDGAVTIDDILYFLFRFENGC